MRTKSRWNFPADHQLFNRNNNNRKPNQTESTVRTRTQSDAVGTYATARPQPPLPSGFSPPRDGGSLATYGTAGRETGKSHPTSPILKGQVREPPDIAQPHCITHHGEDEIQLAGPVPSGFVFIPYIVFLKEERKKKKKRRGEIGKQPRWQTTIAISRGLLISGCPQGKGGGGCGAMSVYESPVLSLPPPPHRVPPGAKGAGLGPIFPFGGSNPCNAHLWPWGGGERRGESCPAPAPGAGHPRLQFRGALGWAKGGPCPPLQAQSFQSFTPRKFKIVFAERSLPTSPFRVKPAPRAGRDSGGWVLLPGLPPRQCQSLRSAGAGSDVLGSRLIDLALFLAPGRSATRVSGGGHLVRREHSP